MMRHEVLVNTSDGRRRVLIDDAFCQSLSVPVGVNAQSVGLFVSSWIALLADSPLNPERKPWRLYRRFLDRIRNEGVKAVVLGFSELAHKLVFNHSLMGTGSSIGDWVDGFKDTPVFFEYVRYYRTGDVKLLDFLYTFLNFGKKLEYEDESFNEVAFRDWLDVEKRLNDHVYVDEDLASLRLILRTTLPTFTLDDFWPRFGPGAVQERGVHGRIGKLRSFQFDPVIDRFLFHGHIGKYGCGRESGISAEKVIPDPSVWVPARGVSSRTARLRFVPKNLKVARSICMEPSVLMYFQQGIARRFLELIGESVMSKFIDIHDQSRNRELALAGSITSEVDTIDLSAASDSVTAVLVKSVFPPSWLIPMLATRSRDVILPNRKVMRVGKFAPMGSALCFPTQCLIFASICIYAACLDTYRVENPGCEFADWLNPSVVLRVVEKFSQHPGYYRGGYQPLAVYGDDICVDGRLTPIIKSILCRTGFLVNETKSFCGSQAFRESCGGFYLNGSDITPLYFRIKCVRENLTPKHVVAHVHLINEARRKGYIHLYRFLHHSLMTWGCHRGLANKASVKNPIPYVTDPDQFGILVPNAANSHLAHREHPDYQRTEVRCWTISYEERVEAGNLLSVVDAYEHMRWWACRTGGQTPEVQSSAARYDTGSPGIRWRWIPAD